MTLLSGCDMSYNEQFGQREICKHMSSSCILTRIQQLGTAVGLRERKKTVLKHKGI